MASSISSSLRLKVIQVDEPDNCSQRLELLTYDLNGKTKNVDVKSEERSENNGDAVELDQTQPIKVLVEGVWSQNPIKKHSIIHLVNPMFDETTNTFRVDNTDGFLVLEPDNLLTCTLVASSLFCERKTWLNHVFLGQVGTNRAMLVGTLVHEVFQYGVKNRIADIEKLTRFLDELLDDATVMLETYSVELHLSDVRKEAISYISSVKEWIDKYMFAGPRYPLTNEADLEVKIIGICDIEENVWSTKYGLKGKIDVTGAVRIYDKRTKSLADKTIPLELKTGNPNLSSSHSAQVSLYSMMIEDRYAETNQGFVIYLKDKAAMHNVALTHRIKRDLIQRRNQINYHLKSPFLGPEMIDQPRVCKNCERLTECITMSNLYAPGSIDEYRGMKSLEIEAIGHLDARFVAFFQEQHEKLVTLTAGNQLEVNGDSQIKSTGSFWTYSSQEAELRGSGFGGLQASFSDDKKETGKWVTFRRHPDYVDSFKIPEVKSETVIDLEDPQPVKKRQKIEDFFKPAKNYVISPGKNKKRPFNTKLNFTRCRIAISLDNDLKNMDSQNSSTAIAIGFMNDLKEDCFVMKLYEGALDSFKPHLMYRVDKLEKKTQYDIERIALIRLLAREDWRCDQIRKLILDPDFKPVEDIKLNLFVLSSGFEEISELEADQQKFVVDAVSTSNYCTLSESIEPDKAKINTIISILAHVIVNLNRTVLIVAQNVDHLVDLMKLLQKKHVKFILIDDGKSTKARYQFAGSLVKVIQSDKIDLTKKFDSYIKQHESAPVVVTSYTMSLGGLLFTRRTFDYCVCYDCDSTGLLMSLAPMFCSNRIIILDVKDDKGSNPKSGDIKVCNEDTTLGEHLRALRGCESITEP